MVGWLVFICLFRRGCVFRHVINRLFLARVLLHELLADLLMYTPVKLLTGVIAIIDHFTFGTPLAGIWLAACRADIVIPVEAFAHDGLTQNRESARLVANLH